MSTVGHEQSAGHQHPGGEGTEVIDLREELLTIGNIRHDQVYRSGSDPSGLCDHLEATAVDPDLANSWPLDLPTSGHFQLLYLLRQPLRQPKFQVFPRGVVPEDLEGVLRQFRLLGCVCRDPGDTAILAVLALELLPFRNLRCYEQLLTDRFDRLVGAAEDLRQPVA